MNQKKGCMNSEAELKASKTQKQQSAPSLFTYHYTAHVPNDMTSKHKRRKELYFS